MVSQHQRAKIQGNGLLQAIQNNPYSTGGVGVGDFRLKAYPIFTSSLIILKKIW